MSHYEDEDEAAKVKAWLKENWKALAAGLALGLVGILGFDQYKLHQANHSAQAAKLYEDFSAALLSNKADQLDSMGSKLKADYANTPYAAQAMLKLAQYDVDAGKAEAALAPLDWVSKNSADDALKPVAQLRAVRVQMQLGKLDAALALLTPELAEKFPAMVEELRGDAQLAKGDRKAARAAYQKSLDASQEAAANRSSLQRKIDDLADAA